MLREEDKRSYPELEGRTCTVVLPDGETYEGVVVGCDYWIGLTIVDVKDKDTYLICFNGPLSPRYADATLAREFLTSWDKIFEAVIEGITKRGRLVSRDLLDVVGLTVEQTGTASAKTCSFQ